MKNPIKAVMIAVSFAVMASGAVILEDDFTSETEFHKKWLGDVDRAPVTVGGGEAAINNSTAGVITYDHLFSEHKTDFTISYVLKSMTNPKAGAGVLFCKQGYDSFSGYFLTLYDDFVVVFRVDHVGNTIIFSDPPVFQKKSLNLNAANNKLTVSKGGSRFHVFVNDEFEGEFTDATYASGDIALFVSSQNSAVFGPLIMTDQFTEGGTWESFSDNFDNGASRYWIKSNNNTASTAEVENGEMVVRTGVNAVMWMNVDYNLTNFNSSVKARYISGGTNSQINDAPSFYGFLLVGGEVAGQIGIPMLHFAIRRDRRSAIFREGSDEIELNTPNPAINGSVISEPDLLEVKKTQGSNNYEFYVNGTLIGTYPATADFKVTGVGVFAYGDLEIAFDDFYTEKIDVPSSIRNAPNRVTQRPRSRPTNHVFYDLKGRRTYSTAHTNGRAPSRTAAGVYVNESQKDVLIRKRR